MFQDDYLVSRYTKSREREKKTDPHLKAINAVDDARLQHNVDIGLEIWSKKHSLTTNPQ